MENKNLKTLREKMISKKSVIIGLVVILGLSITFLVVALNKKNQALKGELEKYPLTEQILKETNKNGKKENVEEAIQFLDKMDEVANYIFELRIKYPHICLAQAILESGRFDSEIAKENYNLFGMKLAMQRPTTAKGLKRGHAYYDSWKMSVVDYALLQASYYKSAKCEEDYYKLLSRSYAEDGAYISKIKKLANSLKEMYQR